MPAPGANGSLGANKALIIDTTAPVIPFSLSIASSTEIGNKHFATSDTTPTITGISEAGSTIEVFRDSTSLGTTTVDGSDFFFTPSSALSEATHSITATATDAVGNNSCY